MAKILALVLDEGLVAVEAACAEALVERVSSARRDHQHHLAAAPPITVMTPDALTIRHAPLADCTCYDSIRRI